MNIILNRYTICNQKIKNYNQVKNDTQDLPCICNNTCAFDGVEQLAKINRADINFTGNEKSYPRHTLNNYAGCILGGAIGDALGTPIEFMSLSEIEDRYGKNGIQDLELGDFGDSEFSDDTQMTIFTIDGLLKDKNKNLDFNETPNMKTLYNSYQLWLNTQSKQEPDLNAEDGWISKLNGLYVRRSPGKTCLTSLSSGKMGTIENPINRSKGCGGIMRVAPVGLMYYQNPEIAFEAAARIAAITHGHPCGYLPAGVLGSVIAYIVQGEDIGFAIHESVNILKKYQNHEETLNAINNALMLAKTDITPKDAIKKLGWGWTGDEALAIALYCVLKSPDSFENAVKMSVNHSGDSDSTGAITGNIAGALNGIKGIKSTWISKVEYSSALKQMSRDLYNVAKDEDISKKYPYNKGRIPNWYSSTKIYEKPRQIEHFKFSDYDIELMKTMSIDEKIAYKKRLIKDGKFKIV